MTVELVEWTMGRHLLRLLAYLHVAGQLRGLEPAEQELKRAIEAVLSLLTDVAETEHFVLFDRELAHCQQELLMTTYPSLEYEQEIVWVDPTARDLPYVREMELPSGTRDRPPRVSVSGRVVAYAVLRPDAPSESPYRWARRVWWVRTAEHGRADPYSPDSMPAEGVRPAAIAAGRPARQ
jgi:hypothetical protein